MTNKNDIAYVVNMDYTELMLNNVVKINARHSFIFLFDLIKHQVIYFKK